MIQHYVIDSLTYTSPSHISIMSENLDHEKLLNTKTIVMS